MKNHINQVFFRVLSLLPDIWRFFTYTRHPIWILWNLVFSPKPGLFLCFVPITGYPKNPSSIFRKYGRIFGNEKMAGFGKSRTRKPCLHEDPLYFYMIFAFSLFPDILIFFTYSSNPWSKLDKISRDLRLYF